MRPNIVRDPGLGLPIDDRFDYGFRFPTKPITLPPPKQSPPVHTQPPPPPPPVRVINQRPRIPIPIRPVIPPPKSTTCPTGQAWNGTQCVPSGTPCQAPNVLDAAGNCVLPGDGTCPPGYVADTTGACTADPRNPYSLYLPDGSSSAAPASSNSATLPTCPSGQFDANGNCMPEGIWQWLQSASIFPGLQNFWVVGAGAAAAFLLFRKTGGRR